MRQKLGHLRGPIAFRAAMGREELGGLFGNSLHAPGKPLRKSIDPPDQLLLLATGLFSDPVQTLRIRLTLQSPSFSRGKSWSWSGSLAASKTIFPHLFRVESPPRRPLLRNSLQGNEHPNQIQPDAVSRHCLSRCEPQSA
jgi:hypothetical protein